MATTSFTAQSGNARVGRLEDQVGEFGRTTPKMRDELNRSQRDLEEVTRRLDIMKGSYV